MAEIIPGDGENWHLYLNRWRLQVALDRPCRSAVATSVFLADYLNCDLGYAWPGQALLMQLLGDSKRTLQDNTAKLCARGHLIMKQAGRGNSVRFYAVLKCGKDGQPTISYFWPGKNGEVAKRPAAVLPSLLSAVVEASSKASAVQSAAPQESSAVQSAAPQESSAVQSAAPQNSGNGSAVQFNVVCGAVNCTLPIEDHKTLSLGRARPELVDRQLTSPKMLSENEAAPHGGPAPNVSVRSKVGELWRQLRSASHAPPDPEAA